MRWSYLNINILHSTSLAEWGLPAARGSNATYRRHFFLLSVVSTGCSPPPLLLLPSSAKRTKLEFCWRNLQRKRAEKPYSSLRGGSLWAMSMLLSYEYRHQCQTRELPISVVVSWISSYSDTQKMSSKRSASSRRNDNNNNKAGARLGLFRH